MEPSYQMSHSSSGQPLERTEKFYKRVIEKVMESSKKHFSENGVSDRVHEKLRQVLTFSLTPIFIFLETSILTIYRCVSGFSYYLLAFSMLGF